VGYRHEHPATSEPGARDPGFVAKSRRDQHVTLIYLVPVVIAATKLGIMPAVIAAVAGGGAYVAP
jgi:hypothetical protein